MPFYHYIVRYIADAKCINTIDGVYLSEKKNLQYKNPKYACEVLKRLKKRYQRDMKTSLNFSDPWELLVATILSAQAKDKQVNKVTKVLFKKYRRIKDFSVMKPAELYKYTKSIGLYRNKTKNIIKTAKELHRKFNDKVPMHMEELTKLSGVGRKTANVVLSNAYNINEGMAIDTHCITVSNRLRMVETKNPVLIERQLMKLIKKEDWNNATHLFIALGRDACTARKKYCERCVLQDICPSSVIK